MYLEQSAFLCSLGKELLDVSNTEKGKDATAAAQFFTSSKLVGVRLNLRFSACPVSLFYSWIVL